MDVHDLDDCDCGDCRVLNQAKARAERCREEIERRELEEMYRDVGGEG